MKKQSKTIKSKQKRKIHFPIVKSEDIIKNECKSRKTVSLTITTIKDIEKRKKLIETAKSIVDELEDENDGWLLF
ncbi:MAG: hypothetical protein N3G74_00335 [Candidatus Micrarchaeota archaeon]|nr:hypothetical protein [Candidatus Micrarchaeota archaeon]